MTAATISLPTNNEPQTPLSRADHADSASELYFLPIDQHNVLVHQFGHNPRLSRKQIRKLCKTAFPAIFTWRYVWHFPFDALLESGKSISRLPACVQQRVNEHSTWSKYPFLAITCHGAGNVTAQGHTMP